MKSRTLTLKKDTLHELTSDEMSAVVGGITTLLLKSLQDCPGLEDVATFPVLRCVVSVTQ